MNLKSLSLVLVVLAISGYEVKGWKMMTALNGWMKTACIAENIKVQIFYELIPQLPCTVKKRLMSSL
jgi:hypothetical protein